MTAAPDSTADVITALAGDPVHIDPATFDPARPDGWFPQHWFRDALWTTPPSGRAPQRHTPPRFVAQGRSVLQAHAFGHTIAATVSPDLPDPDEAARIVADALNDHLR